MPIGTTALFDAVTKGLTRTVGGAVAAFPGMTGASARRLLIRQVVPSFVRAGISGNMGQTLLSQVGLGIRRTDLLALMRTGHQVVDTQNYVRGLQSGERIDVSKARPAEFPHLDKYTGKMRIYYTDPETGETGDRIITMGINEGETKEEMLVRMQREMDLKYELDETPKVGTITDFDLEDFEATAEDFLPWGGAFEEWGW